MTHSKRVRAPRALTASFVAVLAATALVRADEPAGHQTRHQIAERHVELAKKLEKKHPREAFDELLVALEMDEDDHEARTKLGYKKDENKVWQGAPQEPAASGGALDAKLAAEVDHVRKDSATKLVALAKQLKDDRKPDEARYIAGLALEEDPNAKVARELLGHEKRGDGWVSPRESRIRAAFAKCLQGQKGGEAKATGDQAALEKLCGVGALDRRETEHAVLYWSKAAPEVQADGLLRTIETTWLAHRYFIAGDDDGFSVDGDPKREATGGLKAPPFKPNFLIVAPAEHKTFIESAVADKNQQAFAKSLAGWQSWYKAPSGGVLLFEGSFAPTMRVEWVTAAIGEFLTLEPLGKRSALLPDLVAEGVKRFFSGHVSGRAEIFYANTGSSTSKRSFKAGSLDLLRAHAREALRTAPEGELRALLAKKTNDLDQLDSAVALAFFDFLLARERPAFAAFLEGLKETEVPAQTLEKCLKKTLEQTERELRLWVREEY